ncbi:hypothetical protein K7X08_013190 [Anisodus acutangulus]|uniref:Uncharacterized protein n=1 Tax=Anisodus acutangulus TaxID=402998 RepID=A0A9Q1RE83_9SOLA|nr:hypothetical protein K7X08_013190 [Anisodus acutangulus]
MSSVLCRVHALDFDDQFDADECLTEETSSALLENEADRQHKDSPASHKAWNVATSKFSSLHRNNSNYFDPDEDREAARSKDKVCLDTACRNNLSLVDRSGGCDGDSEVVSSTCEILDGVNMDRSSVISANCCEHIEKGHPCSCSVYGSGDASEVCEPTLPGDDGDRKHKVSYVLEQNSSEGSQETDAGELKDKCRRQRPLLKTVARGTALVGVLYLLLHFSRRRNKQESSEADSRRTQSKKLRGRDFSYGDGQNGRRVDKIYPSEKLKFKN